MKDEYYMHDKFQDIMLAAVVRHPDKFVVVGKLMRPEYFWGTQSMSACEGLQDYREQYGHYPSDFHVLADFCYKQLGKAEKERGDEVHGYLMKISRIPIKDLQYVLDRTVYFARERALTNAVRDAAAMITEEKWPAEGFAPMFAEAMKVGQDITDLGRSFVNDSDAIIDLITSKTYGVKTRYRPLDELWPMGWGPGWLISLLAPPKSYKTGFAINLAVNIATSAGSIPAQPVFYYACEISAELAAARGYCTLTGWKIEDVYRNPKKFKAETKSALERQIGAPVILKFFPSKTATISDIKAHAKMLMEQMRLEAVPDPSKPGVVTEFPMKPGAIIIDHAETIKPTSAGGKFKDQKSDWREQADIYTEARVMAAELQCPVIIPDRCNRESVDRATPSITGFQGSMEKGGIVDVAIALCQSKEERVTNLCRELDGEGKPKEIINPIRYFVLINRHGRQFVQFEGTVAPQSMRMTVDREIEWIPEDDSPGKPKSPAKKGPDKVLPNSGDRKPVVRKPPVSDEH
jgi:hypothetical protein